VLERSLQQAAVSPPWSLVMSLVFALALALALPSETYADPAVDFVFQGQPACVELAYTEGRTQLESHCGAPLLVDQSVLAAGIVLPGARVEIRDLSAFTLGLEGKLYRAVATVAEDPAMAAVAAVMGEAGDTAESTE
jgi:hypothetical protein